MTIELLLKNYCIQTAAKKKYEQSISQYFKNVSQLSSEALENIEKKIDILQYFLENADIGQIRSRYPDLNGKKTITVTLISSVLPHEWKLQYENVYVPVIWKE